MNRPLCIHLRSTQTGEGIRSQRHTQTPNQQLPLTGQKTLTLVFKQMCTVFPSTVTEMILPSLKFTHSSPNMSLKTDSRQFIKSLATIYPRNFISIKIFMLLHYKNVLWIYSVTYCNMTSSRVWKTSMSIVLLWVSITAHKAESRSLALTR